MKNRSSILCAIVAACIIPASGTTDSILVNGQFRQFVIDLPTNYTGAVPFGVVLCFHGLGGSAATTRTFTRFHTFGARDSFITVYPQGLNDINSPLNPGIITTGWSFELQNNRDITFVDRLLDSLEAAYSVDAGRVFVTGISNGGFFSDQLGCMLGDRLTAIAPVVGGYPQLSGCTITKRLPVLRLGTIEDEIVSINYLRAATRYWITRNGCDTVPTTNGMCAVYGGCDDGVAVNHCEFQCMKGAYQQQCHTWPQPPAYDWDATEVILSFFKQSRTTETRRLLDNGMRPGVAHPWIALAGRTVRISATGDLRAIEVLDAQGRVLIRAASAAQLDASWLAPGVYTVRLRGAANSRSVTFVKQY